MKVACVLGSPRIKGNSATTSKHLCEMAKQAGIQGGHP